MAEVIPTITPNDLFQKELITRHLIKNKTIDEIFSLLFSPYTANSDNSHNKSFLYKMYSRQNNTDITYNPINTNEKNKFQKKYPDFVEFNYSFTHPVYKKMLIGPNSIHVIDKYNLFIDSPELLIVEVTSTFSGFLLMDTFYSRMQYRFEKSDDNKCDLFLTVKFMIEFRKPNPFKELVLSSGYEETSEFVGKVFINMVDEELGKKEKYEQLNEDDGYNSDYEERINDILFKNPHCSKILVDYCLYEIYC